MEGIVATGSRQAIKINIEHAEGASFSTNDLRHQNFIDKNIDGTWRLDFEEPIPLNLPISEQVESLYRHGYFGEANQALANQYGFNTPAEIIGFRLEEFLPRELPTSIPLLTRLVEAEYIAQEWETVEKDRYGDKKIFVNNCVGEIEEGKLLRVWGTARDITLQKQLEEEARLRSAAFEQIPDGCVIVEAQSEKILYMNTAFTHVTGYAAPDIPNYKLSFLQGAGTNPDTVSELRAAMAHEQDFIGEILNYKRDGTPFWNLMRISPIRDSGGAVTHYAGILTDITAVKRTREILHNQREQLTHVARVASMGELSTAVAHELGQPLTAILSNAQAAQRFLDREDPDVDEVREILKDIISEDKRAGAVIKSIRRLIKRESRQFERLDINKVVNEALALVSNELVIREVNLGTRLAPGLPALLGDTVQLQQVIINLLMNASHALEVMDSGECRIIIATKCQGKRMIEITVSDSGPGIDEEILDQVFQPFFSTRKEGLGMGLAINRTIVEAHGGRLWAENSPDQGAVFHITLPAIQ